MRKIVVFLIQLILQHNWYMKRKTQVQYGDFGKLYPLERLYLDYGVEIVGYDVYCCLSRKDIVMDMYRVGLHEQIHNMLIASGKSVFDIDILEFETDVSLPVYEFFDIPQQDKIYYPSSIDAKRFLHHITESFWYNTKKPLCISCKSRHPSLIYKSNPVKDIINTVKIIVANKK